MTTTQLSVFAVPLTMETKCHNEWEKKVGLPCNCGWLTSEVKVPTLVANAAFTIQASPMKINTSTYVVSVPSPNCRQNPLHPYHPDR